jgi:hypothetical protein
MADAAQFSPVITGEGMAMSEWGTNAIAPQRRTVGVIQWTLFSTLKILYPDRLKSFKKATEPNGPHNILSGFTLAGW